MSKSRPNIADSLDDSLRVQPPFKAAQLVEDVATPPCNALKHPNTDARPLRIHITGASGAGVSTLGASLAKALAVPIFDVDDYYWFPTDPPFSSKRPIPERISLLQNDLPSSVGWVLSGSLDSWGGVLLEQIDHIIFVDTPTAVRVARLREREFGRYGERIRESGDMYHIHEGFMAWAASYDDEALAVGRSRLRHETWLKQLSITVTRLDGSQGPGDVLHAALHALSARKEGEVGV